MAQEIADSKLLDTWGSGGAKIEPDITKIIEGWQLGEQPPHEYMNWLQNTFGSKLNHILKNGVASWNNETEYLAGASVQHSGNVWICETTNTNSEPTDLNANWAKVAINKELIVTVDTLADLRNISYPANTVWASGYHAKNDGAFGSHIFRLKGVKTTETDNGGTVIITTIGGTDYVYELQYDGAVNVKWFGAKGDGVTDDTLAVASIAEEKIYTPALLTSQIKYTDKKHIDGNFNKWSFAVEDDADVLAGRVQGIVFSSEGSDANRIYGATLKNAVFEMPYYAVMGGGTADNHFVINIANTSDVLIENIRVENSDLCLNVGYGAIALTDRGSLNTIVNNFVGTEIKGMGTQIFCSKYGNFRNLNFQGVSTKADFHGVRLTAYNFFHNQFNNIQAVVKNFTNALSIQQYSNNNTIDIVADTVTNGVHIHGHNEDVQNGAESAFNMIKFNGKNISGKGIYNGGSYNKFDFIIDSTGSYGVHEQSQSTSTWLSTNNTYIGKIINAADRGMFLQGKNATIDVEIEGISTASTNYGLVVDGSGVTGKAVIKNCGTGASIIGNNNTLYLTIKDCTNGITISGNNNTIYIDTDLSVNISGYNNKIVGTYGTRSVTGSGNDTVSLGKNYFNKQFFNLTSDSNGYVTLTHNFSAAAIFNAEVFGNNGYYLQPYAQTATTVTCRLFDSSGVRVANATGLTVMLSMAIRLDG